MYYAELNVPKNHVYLFKPHFPIFTYLSNTLTTRFSIGSRIPRQRIFPFRFTRTGVPTKCRCVIISYAQTILVSHAKRICSWQTLALVGKFEILKRLNCISFDTKAFPVAVAQHISGAFRTFFTGAAKAFDGFWIILRDNLTIEVIVSQNRNRFGIVL